MLPYFTRIKRYVIKPTCENFSSFRYFFYEKTVIFSSFVFILMSGARRKLIIESYFTDFSKTITHQAEIFQGKVSTIVIFIPCKLCVNLWTFFRSYECCPGVLICLRYFVNSEAKPFCIIVISGCGGCFKKVQNNFFEYKRVMCECTVVITYCRQTNLARSR